METFPLHQATIYIPTAAYTHSKAFPPPICLAVNQILVQFSVSVPHPVVARFKKIDSYLTHKSCNGVSYHKTFRSLRKHCVTTTCAHVLEMGSEAAQRSLLSNL